jgi:predicted transposase/invertase (TIGR01784 family)
METDSFFCQLLKQLPNTLFELLGLPTDQARAYRFDSVEVKKSLRIDGLFLPLEPGLPLYFVEIQFQHLASFYANLFAKVFCFLEENDPGQAWIAVAIFGSRGAEPVHRGPYEELLQSSRVKRIYLDEFPMPPDPPFGLGLLQLISAPEEDVKRLVCRIVFKAEQEISDSGLGKRAIELVEGLLLRRFTQLDREEVRAMFQLHDLRESKVWQEAHREGIEEGIQEGKTLTQLEVVRNCLAKGMSAKEIAGVLKISLVQVRRLTKQVPKS